MTERKDFMISYTQSDLAWAEWIAWQLEAEGYRVFLQVWDIRPGDNFVAAMDDAVTRADRVLVVLSPEYQQSNFANAEWQAFFARERAAPDACVLPVRISAVEPKGLLASLGYVDLCGKDVMDARASLVAAARTTRGKPRDAPEFPGRRTSVAANRSMVPQYPGDSSLQELRTRSPSKIRADDLGAVRTFDAEIVAALSRSGHSDADRRAFQIAFRELVDNVAAHVGRESTIRLALDKFDRDPYNYYDGLVLEVSDDGAGFDLDATLQRLELELATDGREHGLLRAYRLGSRLHQTSTAPHTIGWMKERTPQVDRVAFPDEVVPFIFAYAEEGVRVAHNVHTFFQFTSYLKRSPQFMDLIFDPLLRPAAKYVGLEILGEGWTGVLQWRVVIDQLLAFTKRSRRFNKELLLYADTGPNEQERLRQYCEKMNLTMFEDMSSIRRFLKE